jgi:hypothetical protein
MIAVKRRCTWQLRGNTDILPQLMQDSPELVLANTDLNSVLHCASTAFGEAVRCLMRSKAVINKKETDSIQHTALHMGSAFEQNRLLVGTAGAQC